MSVNLYDTEAIALTQVARPGGPKYQVTVDLPGGYVVIEPEQLFEFCVAAIRALAKRDSGVLIRFAGEVTR